VSVVVSVVAYNKCNRC